MSFQKQHKSKERIETFGEVYTNEKEVNGMLDLVHSESFRIDSTFLEPACGNGNFLVKILERKLKTIEQESEELYEKNIFIATSSLYGIDIQKDNILECRTRLFNIIKNNYSNFYKTQDENFLKSIQYVLNKNIICGNALTGLKKNGRDIIFSEWILNDEDVKIKEYSMIDIIEYNKDGGNMKLYPLKHRKELLSTHFKEVYNLE